MSKLRNLLAGGVVFTSLVGSPSLDSHLGNSSYNSGSVYAQESGEEKESYSSRLGSSIAEGVAKNYMENFVPVLDKKFQRDIHPLIPSIEDYEKNNKGVENKLKLLLRQGLNEQNPYYIEFKKDLSYGLKNPDEKGFLNRLLKDSSPSFNEFKKSNTQIDFQNFSKEDKDKLFLDWVLNKKMESMIFLFNGIPKEVSGKIPENYGDRPIVRAKLYNNFDLDFSNILNFPNSTYDFFVSAGYEDKNKDGMISMDEITRIEDSNKLYFNKNDNLILGVNSKIGKVRGGSIELYHKDKKVLGSKFDIDSELIKGEFELEKIVDKHGLGFYKAVFLVDDKVNYISQFEVRDK